MAEEPMDRGCRVIVGVDNCPAGLHALRRGVQEARWHGSTLYAVRAWVFTNAFTGPPASEWRREIAAQAAQTVHHAFNAALGGIPADVDVRIVTVEGRSGPALVGYANRDNDLLIVGCRQHGWHGRVWRGSVTRYCLGHACCLVLVAPPPALAKLGPTRALTRAVRRQAQQLADAGRDSPAA